MPDPSRCRQRLREILEGSECVVPASVHDAISGRLAEDLGYEMGMLGGSVASMAVLGAPDLIVLTSTELAEQARRITRACELPLLVDADHGYGNALNTMRTVEELEAAGVAGLTIEDTALPRRHSSAAPPLVPLDEGVAKVAAALEARRDEALVIVGRTSAARLTDLGDAIERACAYESAGVDALMLIGVSTPDDIEAVTDVVGVPLIVSGTGAELDDSATLAARGVRVCVRGHQPFGASIRAVHDTLEALREGASPRDVEGLASPELRSRATRASRYDGWLEKYFE